MDEEFRQAGFVAGVGGEAGAARLQALFERADVVGLDEEHVERVAAALMEAAHREVGVGDLRDLDSVQARGRIEQRERAGIAELLALDRAELRGVEIEDARVAVGCRLPIARRRW